MTGKELAALRKGFSSKRVKYIFVIIK